jgi:hypothetical protein
MEFPQTFISDCLDCDCDVGNIVKTKARTYILEMNDEQKAELISRADYYAGLWGPDEPGLRRSARAVLDRFGLDPTP